jgi:hypothetical protein
LQGCDLLPYLHFRHLLLHLVFKLSFRLDNNTPNRNVLLSSGMNEFSFTVLIFVVTLLGGDALEPSCLDFFTLLVLSSDGRFLQSLAAPLPVLLLLACKKHIQTQFISIDISFIYILNAIMHSSLLAVGMNVHNLPLRAQYPALAYFSETDRRVSCTVAAPSLVLQSICSHQKS